MRREGADFWEGNGTGYVANDITQCFGAFSIKKAFTDHTQWFSSRVRMIQVRGAGFRVIQVRSMYMCGRIIKYTGFTRIDPTGFVRKDENCIKQKDTQPSHTCSGRFIKTLLYGICC